MVRVSNYEVSKYKTLQAALNIQFQAAFFSTAGSVWCHPSSAVCDEQQIKSPILKKFEQLCKVYITREWKDL